MKRSGFINAVITVCAALVAFAAAVLRCIQLFYYTDTATGYVVADGKDLIVDLYVCAAASVLLFGLVSFLSFHKSAAEYDLAPGKGMFWFSLLCAAGMFYDFIYQCVRCYLYLSKTAFPAANRIAPMIFCAVFALVGCAYFAVLCQCSHSRRFEFGRLLLLRLAPLFWVLFNILVGLTDYGNVLYDVDSALKYLALIFGLLFFFLLFASREKQFRRLGALVFFGYSYGSLCFVLAFPRIVAFVAGRALILPNFSAPAFLFTGIFAFAAAVQISFKKKA